MDGLSPSNTHMAPSTPLLTVRQVAELLSVSSEVVSGLIRDGYLPARMIGKRYRIDAADFDTYYAATKVPVTRTAS